MHLCLLTVLYTCDPCSLSLPNPCLFPTLSHLPHSVLPISLSLYNITRPLLYISSICNLLPMDTLIPISLHISPTHHILLLPAPSFLQFYLLPGPILEECLSLRQRAELACIIAKVRKVNHAFLPEGIQIEDLTQASCHA